MVFRRCIACTVFVLAFAVSAGAEERQSAGTTVVVPNEASAEAGLGLDTRSGILTRKRGVTASAALGAPGAAGALLAVRLAGERNWGRYPFFEAASIGGAAVPSPLDVAGGQGGKLLRGYDLELASAMSFAVVRSDEGTTFYLPSRIGF